MTNNRLIVRRMQMTWKRVVRKKTLLLSIVIALSVVGAAYYFSDSREYSMPIIDVPTLNDWGVPQEQAQTDYYGSDWYGYKIREGARVYYSGRLIENADAETFVDIGNGWAKDARRAYFSGDYVPELDPASIEVLSLGYVKDTNGVFYTSLEEPMRLLEGAATTSFEIVDGIYGTDGRSVYVAGAKLSGANPQSFIVMKTPLGHSKELYWSLYSKDDDQAWYFKDEMLEADAESFVSLGSDYAKDSTRAYYKGKATVGVDAQTFAVKGFIGWDTNRVYLHGEQLDIDVDPSSLAVLNNGLVIKDARGAYKYNYETGYKKLDNIDPITFDYVGSCATVEKSGASYFKDKNNVYVEEDLLEEIDSSTFLYFGSYATHVGMPSSISYAIDRNAVYVGCGVKLKEADASTFIDIKDGYAKDDKSVWYLGRIIQNADSMTFSSLGSGYAKDKSSAYFMGIAIEGSEPVTFEIVKMEQPGRYPVIYAKDSNHVYMETSIVESADPSHCVTERIEDCNPKNQRRPNHDI